MQTIWKYPVPVADSFTILMPKGARFLTVQTQKTEPQMWALVDRDQPLEERRFHLLGTGHSDGDRALGQYVGTFQVADGTLIFHLFEAAT